jgi:hypothetical protein
MLTVKRLRRLSLNSLAVFAVLLCVIACVLWIRTYSLSEEIWFHLRPRPYFDPYLQVGTWRGQVALVYIHYDYNPNLGWYPYSIRGSLRYDQDIPKNGSYGVFGFDRLIFDSKWITARGVYIPLWFIVSGSGALAYLALKWCRLQIPKGKCSNCGYDLRATPDRCPECGSVVKPNGKN